MRTKRRTKVMIFIIIATSFIDYYINTVVELICITFNGGIIHKELQLVVKTT